MKRRRGVPEIRELSAPSVREAATVACAGDPTLSIVAEDDPAMLVLVRALTNWRELVRAEQAQEEERLELGQFVAGLQTVLRLGPRILRGHVETMRAVEALDPASDPHVPPAQAMLPEMQASAFRQMTLIGAATAVANDPRVVHPVRWAALPIDTYSQFLPALGPLFSAIVTRADGSAAQPQKPYFSFAAAVLTVVTGKLVTREMVRTHLTRGRSAHWARPGLGGPTRRS